MVILNIVKCHFEHSCMVILNIVGGQIEHSCVVTMVILNIVDSVDVCLT